MTAAILMRPTVAKQTALEETAGKRPTAMVRLYADLNQTLAEIAALEGRSVAEIVDESDLRIWALERLARTAKGMSKRGEEAAKTAAELKAKRKNG